MWRLKQIIALGQWGDEAARAWLARWAMSAPPLRFESLPPKGTRYLVVWALMVVFAAVMLILSTDLQTFLAVLGVSVLFVILVSAVLRGMF